MSEEEKQWIKEQSKKISMVSPEIIPMSPNMGFYFKINNIEIPESLFKEEFDAISKSYFSVIEKIKSHK